MAKIEAVILYCSYDAKFIDLCCNQLVACGIKPNIVSYTHLWGGDEEPEVIMKHNHKIIQRYIGYPDWYWEALGRRKGVEMVSDDCEYILFIDPDEILDAEMFREWLYTGKYKKYKGIQLSQYTYSISPTYRLDVKAFNTIMCRRDFAERCRKEEGRLQYMNNGNRISRWLRKLGLSNKFYIERSIMIHHYTGVHTKAEMHIKVENWGHRSDRSDWHEIIDKEFKVRRDRARRKVIGKHTFTIVENKFNL